MTTVELATSITETLAKLNTVLSRDDIEDDKPKYQLLIALQKHLNGQQLALTRAQIQADDVDFLIYSNTIVLATKQLDTEIASMKHIDAIITTVSQISASLDDVLKLV